MSSSGWEGNDRAIFIKLSDTEYTHRNETKVSGAFKPAFEKHCKKVLTH